MDFTRLYKITLENKKDLLIQYIEGDSMDDAENNARNTFHARLYGLNSGPCNKTSQKLCKLSKVNHDLRFGFCGGWTTVHAENLTFFEMLELAKQHKFTDGKEIEEVMHHEYK